MGAYINQFRPRMHLTIEEAARRFGITPQRLAIAVRQHQLAAKRLAHRTWVMPNAVAQFLELERRRAEWSKPA
jgi:hypothetical protein